MQLSPNTLFYAVLLVSMGTLFTGCQPSPQATAEEQVEGAMRGVETGLLPAVVVRGEPTPTTTIEARMEFFNVLIPTARDSFIDRFTSDQAVFARSAEGTVTAFVYNDTYRFERQ